MKTLTNILLIVTLGLTVFLCNRQEQDIISLRHWNHMQEGGLDNLYGGLTSLDGRLAQLEGGSDSVRGGLGSTKGGLEYLLSCSATLRVMKSVPNPITIMGQGPIMQVSTMRGTGFFMSDNILVTAKHVVENRIADKAVTVTGPDGVTYAVVEVLEDADDDLAVVVLEGRTGPYLEMGVPPSLGDVVTSIGTPLWEQPQLIITWGRVSSLNWKNMYIIDGFCKSGCSGGPVTVAGKVTGVISRHLVNSTSLGFTVPIQRLDADLLGLIN